MFHGTVRKVSNYTIYFKSPEENKCRQTSCTIKESVYWKKSENRPALRWITHVLPMEDSRFNILNINV